MTTAFGLAFDTAFIKFPYKIHMEIYTLLQEFGLDVGIKDFVKEKKEEIKKGFQPLRHDGEKAVFTSEQIADYGPPELYGFTVYVVIELQETAHPLTSDYDFERDRERPRPIHRYSRLERFEFTLAQLLGRRGEVPDMVMSMMVFANKERGYAVCLTASINSSFALLNASDFSPHFSHLTEK